MLFLLIISVLLSIPNCIDLSDYAYSFDSNVSFYGPGFYGNRTACGFKLTTKLKGVAHRTLPCGTMVTFISEDSEKIQRKITIPVVDRGPYVRGRQWDLTGGACQALKHCYTGSIYYRIEK